jgi:hypothetical protein
VSACAQVGPAAVGLQVHLRQLPDLAGVVDTAALQPPRLLVRADLKPVLDQDDAGVELAFSKAGAISRNLATSSGVQKPITLSMPGAVTRAG